MPYVRKEEAGVSFVYEKVRERVDNMSVEEAWALLIGLIPLEKLDPYQKRFASCLSALPDVKDCPIDVAIFESPRELILEPDTKPNAEINYDSTQYVMHNGKHVQIIYTDGYTERYESRKIKGSSLTLVRTTEYRFASPSETASTGIDGGYKNVRVSLIAFISPILLRDLITYLDSYR